MASELAVRNSNDANDPLKDLEWVAVNAGSVEVSSISRLKDKIMKNPFVPLGMLATAGILAAGIRSFYIGNQKRSQLMMRWRIGMQLATICLLIGGIVYEGNDLSKLNR